MAISRAHHDTYMFWLSDYMSAIKSYQTIILIFVACSVSLACGSSSYDIEFETVDQDLMLHYLELVLIFYSLTTESDHQVVERPKTSHQTNIVHLCDLPFVTCLFF